MTNEIIFLDEEPVTTPARVAPARPYVAQGTDGSVGWSDVGTAVKQGVRSIEKPATIGIDRALSGFTGGLSVWADAIATKQPGESLKQSLERVRTRRAQEAEQYPAFTQAAETVGQVGSAVYGGPLVQVPLQGALGATEKWTESPDTTWQDAAKSAAIRATGAAVGATGAKIIGGVTKQVEKRAVNTLAKDMDVTKEEAAQLLKANQGQTGTWDVLKGGVKATGNLAAATALPVAGAVGGGYLGGKAAPVFGIDKSTGQIIGAELGGGGGTLAAWKSGVAKKAASGLLDTVGFAASAYPRTTSVLRDSSKVLLPSGAAAASYGEKKAKGDIESLPDDSGIIFLD